MRRVTWDDRGNGHCWNDEYDNDDSSIEDGLYGHSNGNGSGRGPLNGYMIHGDGDHTYGDGNGDGGGD